MRGNLVGYLALFVALGGTSYAAVQLPANSVGTRQVIDGSLRKQDFKRGQLPRGPRGLRGVPGSQGEQGPRGEQGPPGAVPGSETVSSEVGLPPGETKTASVACPPGTVLLGGGFALRQGRAAPVTIWGSEPDGRGWKATAYRAPYTGAPTDSGGPAYVVVRAVCG